MKIKNRLFAFIIYVIVFLLFANVLEYIIAVYIQHSVYRFNLLNGIVDPGVIALIIGYFVIYKGYGMR